MFYYYPLADNSLARIKIETTDTSTDMQSKLNKAKELFNYAKRNVSLNSYRYRILIKSRNNNIKR